MEVKTTDLERRHIMESKCLILSVEIITDLSHKIIYD